MPSGELSPPQPSFVLRGHSAQIHACHFTRHNARLLTGDSEGWAVSWNLAYKRPVAVWRPHKEAILGLASWGADRIITHGRDNQILVWRLGPNDEDQMGKTLPVDIREASDDQSRQQPWLLYAMPVNSLNFCSFAMCLDGMSSPSLHHTSKGSGRPSPILLVAPNALDSSGIDVFQLPGQTRVAVIHKDRDVNTGMVMALSIHSSTARIQVAAGYESGHTAVFVQHDPAAAFEKVYCAQPHKQPVLSLTISPNASTYMTTSADALIALHPFPAQPSIFDSDPIGSPLRSKSSSQTSIASNFSTGTGIGGYKPLKIVNTKHAGQQGVTFRSDGRIFATAGWDGSCRVWSGKTLKEVAVLKRTGGSEVSAVGCYCTSFAEVVQGSECCVPRPEMNNGKARAGLENRRPDGAGVLEGGDGITTPTGAETWPDQNNNDGHDNDQDTSEVKSDETHVGSKGNNDSAIPIVDESRRVTRSSSTASPKSSPPHQEQEAAATAVAPQKNSRTGSIVMVDVDSTSTAVASTGMTNVQQRRQERAQTTHWLAVGSKDGKVTLWDIF